MYVCALCNGLEPVTSTCPQCGQVLTDGGAIIDYYGPYSPYMSKDSIEPEKQNCCIHLLYCNNCGYDKQECGSSVQI